MEGTAGLVVLAGFLERDAPVDYFDDIDTVEQFVNKALRNQACHRLVNSIAGSVLNGYSDSRGRRRPSESIRRAFSRR